MGIQGQTIISLQHFLIKCKDLEKTKDFYTDILGLKTGKRPNFPFEGYWLFLQDIPVLHLISEESSNKLSHYEKLSSSSHIVHNTGTGAIDHVAFSVKEINYWKEHLEKNNVKYSSINYEEDNNNPQIFFYDPNNVKIELNFI